MRFMDPSIIFNAIIVNLLLKLMVIDKTIKWI